MFEGLHGYSNIKSNLEPFLTKFWAMQMSEDSRPALITKMRDNIHKIRAAQNEYRLVNVISKIVWFFNWRVGKVYLELLSNQIWETEVKKYLSDITTSFLMKG